MKLAEKLKSYEDMCFGGKADTLTNIYAQKYLAGKGMTLFPKDYLSFIKNINGVRNDTVRIFGIDADMKNSSNDAIAQNEKIGRVDRDKVVVLGYNVFDYLIYDNETKQYQMRDINDDMVVGVYKSFDEAVCRLFGIE